MCVCVTVPLVPPPSQKFSFLELFFPVGWKKAKLTLISTYQKKKKSLLEHIGKSLKHGVEYCEGVVIAHTSSLACLVRGVQAAASSHQQTSI